MRICHLMFDWLQARKETQVPLDLPDLLGDQEGQDCLVALDLKVLISKLSICININIRNEISLFYETFQ